jgi:uncharacterized protein
MRCLLSALIAVCLCAAPALAQVSPAKPAKPAKSSAPPTLTHLKWSDLVPPGWDPSQEMGKHIQDPNIGLLQDDDPRVQEMLKQMREVWDKAPVNPAMDGVQGRIPGYVVPLEVGKQGLSEMLLVPYYGACIHTPPPPANQIIHVFLSKPAKGVASMDTVWVSGTLKAFRGDSYMGVSGYRIEGATVAPYEKTPPQVAR